MLETANDYTENNQHFFDKFTGQRYFCVSETHRDGIKHYRLKSEDCGDAILLSESGLKLRFHSNPDIGSENLKNLFRRSTSKR